MGKKIKNNKENENFSYILHNTYNISEIKNHILSYGDEEWFLDTKRQEVAVHHKKTQTYKISFFELTLDNDFSNYKPEFCDYVDQKLIDLISPIIKDMENIYDGVFGRILLTKLPAGEKITPHIDILYKYFDIARRFHVPIISNKDVFFSVDGEVKNMKEGECWEINNKKMHRVFNNSLEDRVHLLFDIIPKSELINHE